MPGTTSSSSSSRATALALCADCRYIMGHILIWLPDCPPFMRLAPSPVQFIWASSQIAAAPGNFVLLELLLL